MDALYAIQSIVIQVCETKEPIHVPPSNYDLYILGREDEINKIVGDTQTGSAA